MSDPWYNAPELRQAVKDLLINWAWHYSGGQENLGYPDHQPFTTPPLREKPRPPRYLGLDDAVRVEAAFRQSSERWPEEEPKSLRSLASSLRPGAYRMYLRIDFVLMAGYAEHTKAKALGMGRSTYRRRVEEAMFWFWQEFNRLDSVDKKAYYSGNIARDGGK